MAKGICAVAGKTSVSYPPAQIIVTQKKAELSYLEVFSRSTLAITVDALIFMAWQSLKSISSVGDFLLCSSILMYVRSTLAFKANSS